MPPVGRDERDGIAEVQEGRGDAYGSADGAWWERDAKRFVVGVVVVDTDRERAAVEVERKMQRCAGGNRRTEATPVPPWARTVRGEDARVCARIHMTVHQASRGGIHGPTGQCIAEPPTMSP